MSRTIDYAPLISPSAGDPGLKPDAQLIAAFARANGWEYYPTAFDQPLPGVVFRSADGRGRFAQLAGNVVRIPGATPIEVGNSAYQSIVEGNAIAREWGYAAVQPAVAAPAVVVEAHRLRGRHPLPALPDLDPVVRGERFDVYAAPAALDWVDAVFDPAMLAALDDGTLAFHVELASGWLFLYAPGTLATTDPALWQRVLTVLDLLLVRIAAASSSPAAAPALSAAAASAPLREKRWRVERRMRLAYIGVAVGSMVLFGIAAAVFGPR